MNKLQAAIAVVLTVSSGVASASGAFTGRVGATLGNYSSQGTATSRGCCGPDGTVYLDYDDSSAQYGLILGGGVSVSRFFVDLGVELTTFSDQYDQDGDGVEDAYFRTDGLLTTGVFLGDHFSLFGGYRHATFGTGVFSDGYGSTEYGPFAGAGVSFRPGKKIGLGLSVAYNDLTLEFDGSTLDDVDYSGLSVKGQLNIVGTPHAVFLRWQRFDADVSYPGDHDYEQTDDYINVGYTATFDFSSW
jgi:hypothetical protein